MKHINIEHAMRQSKSQILKDLNHIEYVLPLQGNQVGKQK